MFLYWIYCQTNVKNDFTTDEMLAILYHSKKVGNKNAIDDLFR